MVFSEVVEHLEDPELGMEILGRSLGEAGLLFFSTATNAAFYDHTIVFRDVGEIEDLLDRHGFEILSNARVPVFAGPEGRDVVDYNAVLRARPTDR